VGGPPLVLPPASGCAAACRLPCCRRAGCGAADQPGGRAVWLRGRASHDGTERTAYPGDRRRVFTAWTHVPARPAGAVHLRRRPW